MIEDALADCTVENVLFVSVDCLRADAYRGALDRGLVDAMADLHESGVSFENAFTIANTTDPSLTSTMTSTYPQTHGVRENGVGLDEETPVLAEQLRSAGVETFGVVSVDHLSHEHSGLGRGFDAYCIDDSYDTLYPYLSRIFDTKTFNVVFGAVKGLGTERYNVKNLLRDLGLIRLHCRTGRSVTDDAVAQLDERSEPVFGWVHYFDVHEPRNFDRGLLADHDEYIASLITVDDCLAELLAKLDEQGIRERTLVVFTADHGENLGDHGYTGHGRTLYDEEIHVPLVFSHPDLDRASVDAQVRSIDVAPTILDALGVDVPETFQGESLAVPEDALEGQPVFATAYPEFTDAVCVRESGWKLVRTGDDHELYDLAADPDERTDLSDDPDHTETFERLRDRLETWEGRQRGKHRERELDAETEEMLEDLGYVD
jgi:arylsulfatase A-like enzyme